MRLTEDIYLIGGGSVTGFGLTSGFDCHVYLVDGGDALALVDSGVGGAVSLSEMESNIRSHGFDPEDVETAFITHYHSDHAGGGHLIRDRWEARLAVSSDAVAVLEAGDEEANGLAAAREAGIYPDDTRFHPTPIDDSLSDGDVRRVGSATFEFMATPGHCAGHGSYLLTSGSGATALFTGDSLFWAGRILLQSVPDCDLQKSLASIERMAATSFEAFLPGHGALTVANGQAHVAMAKAEIDNLGVPKNLL